ncbi:MAG TPA: hypothetical protein VHZ03_40625 [Trebonia sp.]|jgi:hypothetical protein|nr:hypothetical protein [Trebonia sp.]
MTPADQHVFLFYFENEDPNEIIGNTKQAPYVNSLTHQGALLTGFYAEEHPSDGNYLAFAGGSTFGVPPDDPKRKTRSTRSTRRTSATSSPTRARPGRPIRKARTARAMTPCRLLLE